MTASKNIQAVFKLITQGVYVISVIRGEHKNAFTAAWVMQVSFDPLLLCFSINPQHHSYKMLRESGVCCLSVLDKKQYPTADHFGRSDIIDKMSDFTWVTTQTGAPALADSLAYFDCRVDHYTDAGDHEIVICQVLDAAIIHEGQPLLYSDTGDMDNSRDLYEK